MILTTGGRAIGATSTRSSPRASAAARASSIDKTPSCSPESEMTRTGLIRIIRLTRVRRSRSFVLSGRPPVVAKQKHPAGRGVPERSPAETARHEGANQEPVRRAAGSGWGAVGPPLQVGGRLAGEQSTVNGQRELPRRAD